MGTTTKQIEDACGAIEQSLASFAESSENVLQLQRAMADLAWLREQYAADKTLLTPYMDRLKDLSRQVREAAAAAKDALTAQFLRATAAAGAWTDIRDACREALADLAASQGIKRFDCPDGAVFVNQSRSLSLPKTGSSQREELLALISETGRWPQVGQPNPTRLLKAIDQGLFTPQHAAQLAALCPVHTISRLVAKPNQPS